MNNKELEQHFRERKPQQCINAIRYILSKVREIKPQVYLEIGCRHLATLEIFESILPTKKEGGLAIGVDVVSRGWEEFKDVRPLRGLCFIEGNSTQENTIKQVQLGLNGKEVDFLLIDGCHDYDVVKKDFENYSRFVRTGGLVAFHDTSPGDGPWRVIEELASSGYIVDNIPRVSMATTLVVNK